MSEIKKFLKIFINNITIYEKIVNQLHSSKKDNKMGLINSRSGEFNNFIQLFFNIYSEFIVLLKTNEVKALFDARFAFDHNLTQKNFLTSMSGYFDTNSYLEYNKGKILTSFIVDCNTWLDELKMFDFPEIISGDRDYFKKGILNYYCRTIFEDLYLYSDRIIYQIYIAINNKIKETFTKMGPFNRSIFDRKSPTILNMDDTDHEKIKQLQKNYRLENILDAEMKNRTEILELWNSIIILFKQCPRDMINTRNYFAHQNILNTNEYLNTGILFFETQMRNFSVILFYNNCLLIYFYLELIELIKE